MDDASAHGRNAQRSVRLGRCGFALVVVLWFLVGISAITLHWGLRTKETRRLAQNVVAHSAAVAAAEAGLAHTWARLDGALKRQVTASEGDPIRIADPWWDLSAAAGDTSGEVQSGRWRAHASDLGSKLNLNVAAEDELRRFFVALQIDAAVADELAQSIADWRDSDSFHRPRGGEAEWYEQNDRVAGPSNRPFRSVGELRHVKGMSEDIYDRSAGLLAVVGSGRINVGTASPAVLLSLRGIGPEVAELVRLRRQNGQRVHVISELAADLPPAAQSEFMDALPTLLLRMTTETEEVLIESTGTDPGSSVHVRATAVITRSLGMSAVHTWWTE